MISFWTMMLDMETCRFLLVIFLSDILLFCMSDVNKGVCKGLDGDRCCEGFQWNELSRNCTKCKAGYTGHNCSIMCTYPFFGDMCQQECSCSKLECNIVHGCRKRPIRRQEQTTISLIKDLNTASTIKNINELSGRTNNTVSPTAKLSKSSQGETSGNAVLMYSAVGLGCIFAVLLVLCVTAKLYTKTSLRHCSGC